MRKAPVHRLAVVLAALVLTAGAAVADEPPLVPAETTYYLAWQDCGSDSDTYLSQDVPPLNYCGWLGLPLNEVFHVLGDPWVDVYATQDPVALRLDADRRIKGEVHVHSATGATGAGIGQVVVEGQLSVRVDGRTVLLGSFDDSAMATPAQATVAFPWDLEIPAALHERVATSLTLDLVVRGVNADSAVEASGGLSRLVVPTLVDAASP